VKSGLSAARNRPTRFKPGQVRFEDTDTFKNRLIKSMPQDALGRPLKGIKGLPEGVQRAFPKDASVRDVVGMKLRPLMRKTGLSLQQTVQLRQRLLGRKAD
jgi:hypothetical protein